MSSDGTVEDPTTVETRRDFGDAMTRDGEREGVLMKPWDELTDSGGERRGRGGGVGREECSSK